MAKEKTGPQVATRQVADDGVLHKPLTSQLYNTYRLMKVDPTIALTRWLITAPIATSGWSIESTPEAPEGARELIDKVFQPLRLHLLQTAMNGHIDFGWAPYEKVFKRDEVTGQIVYRKLKPLIQDYTEVLVHPETGAFRGLKQSIPEDVEMNSSQSLLITVEYEGTDFYGVPVLESARLPYDRWNDIEKAAGRYDEKMAGSSWVVSYPIGTSMVNGEEKDNFDIAKEILSTMEASGTVAIPSRISDQISELDSDKTDAWKIEIKSDNSAGRSSFTEREKYLDGLKVRGMGFPERAVTEGQYGTKAEAEAHGDFAITNLDFKHQVIVEQVNWHAVNQILMLNYGREAENTVSLVPNPIADEMKHYLRTIYSAILANPDAGLMEIQDLDLESIREKVGLPAAPEELVNEDGSPAIKLLDPEFKIA